LFDVDLPSGETYRESNSIAAGDRGVLASLPFATLGMSVCYDLRFPGLYRGLAQAGADLISIPAAFTRTTGEAHWHVLLRARAIETGAFVIAPAMWGNHPGNRQTYGHSLVVDPWGRVLADAGEGVRAVTVEIDLAEVAKARAQIPAWRHDPSYAMPARAAERKPFCASEKTGSDTPVAWQKPFHSPGAMASTGPARRPPANPAR